MLKRIWRKLRPQKKVTLRIRRADENQGGLLLGDTGTGKTQFLHQGIYQARADERREPGVGNAGPVGSASETRASGGGPG